MKTHSITIIVSLMAWPLLAADFSTPLQPKAGKRLKIACVGDSITQGSGAAPSQSYPSQLQEMLGSDWEVGNFGVSGRTLLKKGDFPYWNEGKFKQAKDFDADAVIIMLGTNDTKPQNWKSKDDFEGDYRELIQTFQKLRSSPRVYVCRPVPVPDPGNFGINEKALQEQMPVLKKLSAEMKTGTIDMYAALERKPELLPDRVHPNTEGAGKMAKAAFKVLTGKSPEDVTRVNSLFRDHAVLQRDVEVPVWGTAANGTKISVQFSGQTATTTASGGKWMVQLKPMKASAKGATLTVTGSTTITLNDVLVGDVWLASGQSNMYRTLKPEKGHHGIIGWKEAADAAKFPLIREYKVPKTASPTESADARGTWSVCSPETAGAFSGVGFFFARDIHETQRVPIGLISSSWGGTAVEAWIAAGAAKDLGIRSKEYRNERSPSSLYNGMIAPLHPFPFKGVIWYQGESNNGNAGVYERRFSTMITDWRKQWNAPELPFLFVQIAPYKDSRPELREAQFLTSLKIPRTAMAVTVDVGDEKDIHPVGKAPVGQRLALAARAIAYGEKIEYSGPVYDSVKFSGSKAAVTFSHVGKGMEAKGGGALKGFTIAGSDGNFVPANAEIKGSAVIVSSDEVKQPKSVRYGWTKVPDVNLFNKDGLPASPFRTDVN